MTLLQHFGLIRETFKTFCFADAETIEPAAGGVATVDTSKAPGRDESSFLVALLTAVCRPSLHLAPGVLLRAAPMSGAGAGKGLLARCICIIAFGREPHAVTAGANAEELEKRIAAELIEGSPALFLDNLNNTAFKSDLLASAITERPARVRLLGRSQMVPLNASAFVILTGNGLTVSEDLARRFVAVDFDARTEDPEARPFATDIRVEVTERRTELLAALLTIWRWGRIATDIKPGIALGSFEQWCRWVRDPLLALGCQDPVERVSEAKQRDGRRQAVADLFAIWWDKHQDHPVAVRQLHDDVKQALDPQGRGRQYVASQVEKLAGTRMAGFVFTRQAPAGKWGAATYALKRTAGEEGHRDHRGHRGGATARVRRCPLCIPMPMATATQTPRMLRQAAMAQPLEPRNPMARRMRTVRTQIPHLLLRRKKPWRRPGVSMAALPPGYPSAKFRNLPLGTSTGLPTASTRTAGSSLTAGNWTPASGRPCANGASRSTSRPSSRASWTPFLGCEEEEAALAAAQHRAVLMALLGITTLPRSYGETWLRVGVHY